MLRLPYCGSLQNLEQSEAPGKLFTTPGAAVAMTSTVYTHHDSQSYDAEQPGAVFRTTKPRLYP